MPESELQICSPSQLGLCQDRWKQTLQLASRLCETQEVRGLSFQIQRQGKATPVQHYGSALIGSQKPIDEETRFLVASITKPILAMGILKLVEAGKIGLNQRVSEFLPECRQAERRLMTIRHLLSHTSGLPDMLPNNVELRKRHAPIADFVAASKQIELLSPVGRSAQYQSTGYALLGEIIEQITKRPCSDFLNEEIFAPLGMRRTTLGLCREAQSSLSFAEIQVPAEQLGNDHWNWNSEYWRALGAAWGGLISTTQDLSKFLWNMMSERPLWSSCSIELATENRLDDFSGISESDRRTKPWGLGWRLNWPDHKHALCELMPAETCGHWGATGTLFWMHRPSQTGVVILSTLPVIDQSSPLSRLSNALAASIC